MQPRFSLQGVICRADKKPCESIEVLKEFGSVEQDRRSAAIAELDRLRHDKSFFHAIGRKGAEIGANIRAMLFVLVAVLCLLVAAVYVADQAVCQPHTAQSFSA